MLDTEQSHSQVLDGLGGPELRMNTVFIDCHLWVFFRVSMEGHSQEAVVVLKDKGSVSGLAVDWIHQLLYWTDMKSGSVNVGLLHGLVHRQLITGLDKPSGVAVDPLQG